MDSNFDISYDVILKKFHPALISLKKELVGLTSSYEDVTTTQLAQECEWGMNDEGNLTGSSWLFGLLARDSDGVPDITTMVWDGEKWISPELKEAHMDDPWAEPHTFGGAEPVPGDTTGKDQRSSTGMTMESLRRTIRKVLLEIF